MKRKILYLLALCPVLAQSAGQTNMSSEAQRTHPPVSAAVSHSFFRNPPVAFTPGSRPTKGTVTGTGASWLTGNW